MSKLETAGSRDGRMIFRCQEMLGIRKKDNLNTIVDIFCYLLHVNRLNDVNICSLCQTESQRPRMRVQISSLVNFIYYERYITVLECQNDLNVAIKSRKEEKLVKINQ